jgi:hypothetical protein
MAAPDEVTLVGAKETLATPAPFVSAVPPAGVMVAIAALVEKVTTAFGMGTPVESVSVAITVAGEVDVIDVTAVPDALTREMLIVPAAVVVVVPLFDVEVVVGAPLPPQLDNNVAMATNNKAVNVLA